MFRTLFLLCLLWFSMPALAQQVPVESDITKVELISAVSSVQPGQKFWTAVHLKIKKGWHTYWQNPGDSGVAPKLEWTLPNGFTAADIHYLAPNRQSFADLMNYGYEDDAYFLVPITPPAMLRPNANYIISLKASWLVCSDICVPESADLSLVLRTSANNKSVRSEHFDLLASLVSRLPKPVVEPLVYAISGQEVRIAIPETLLGNSGGDRVEFFPIQSGFIANAPKQVFTPKGKDGVLTLVRGDSSAATEIRGVLSIFSGGEKTIAARKNFTVSLVRGEVEAISQPESTGTAGNVSGYDGVDGIGQAILFALLGGLILNLMPCVFPVLSLKALDIFSKSLVSPEQVRRRGLSYTAGVLTSFLVMAVLLLLIQQANVRVGWGTQFQSPLLVGVFAYLLFMIGLNLSGLYEIPAIFGNVGDGLARKKNALGSFFTGVLAVIVATPCTAPFMGAAIGYAFTQPPSIVLAVFTAMGIGMSLPFLLISYFPALTRKLPKPGAWMEHFRQFLAFPMYLSVVWLLWVIGRQTGVDLVAGILIGFLFITFAFWLWWFFKEQELLVRVGIAIPLVIISVIPLFFLPAQSISNTTESCSPVAMLEYGEPFSTERLQSLQNEKKPVFVNATAAWCITCQINERTTLGTPEVRELFATKGITYMVADWTNHNDEITKYLESFGRRGVPIYVYYPPQGEPKLLPQILTESIVREALQ